MQQPVYEIVLLRRWRSGARTSRVQSWDLADFNNLENIENDCELAGEIRSARERFEAEECEEVS